MSKSELKVMSFKLGLTRDLLDASGQPSFGTGPMAMLDQQAGIDYEFLPETITEITPDVMARYDGLYVNNPQVTARSVARADCRVKIVSRHGVGYDSVDVKALADKGIITTNTPVAVRRPVAVAALTFVFALAGRLIIKDQLTRQGRWHERTSHMGLGLTSRTIGIIGAGGIGQELIALARPFGWRMLASDPHATTARIESLGAQHVSSEQLLAQSDFVVSTLILNAQTRHFLNAQRLSLMQKHAYFINMARGAVVDEAALIHALQTGAIAGAALDVFEQEPVATDNPLLKMDNVLLTPHSICWTDECFDHIAREGLGCLVAFANGQIPLSIVKA
jgi:phosphoglycerate dehydrogenase-like enzyme